MKIKDKVAIVTGSSNGIGKSIAFSLAREGAWVVVNYIKDKKSAEELIKKINDTTPGEAVSVKADVTNKKEVESIFKEAIKYFKTVDILVNNVGDSEAGDFGDLELWDRQLKTVLLSNVLCSSEFLKINNNSLRKILNISSIYGLPSGSDPNFMAFAAAKAGVNSFTVNLANKFGEAVQVNALALGYVWTRHWGEDMKKWEKGMESASKLKRFITVEETAEMAVSILKNDAMNGQIITLDGGATLKNIY